MKTLYINARCYDPMHGVNQMGNVLINDGVICGFDQCNEDAKVIDLKGKWLCPSVVDMHVHCFKDKTELGLAIDEIGVTKQVGTVVDAGSSGSLDMEELMAQIKQAETKVKVFINYSSIGLTRGSGELADHSLIDETELIACVKRYPDIIKGIKLRASATVVGNRGIEPIKAGKQLAKKLGLPVMVHIGNEPPVLEEVLECLEKGDIITHIFHGKPKGIFNEDGTLKKIVRDKYQEGVLFDVGHGAASFSFDVCERAIQEGILPNLISSDLHARNYKSKIQSLNEVVSKLYACGLSEYQILDAISILPSQLLKLNNGLAVGNRADLSVIDFQSCENMVFKDAQGSERIVNKQVVLSSLIR